MQEHECIWEDSIKLINFYNDAHGAWFYFLGKITTFYGVAHFMKIELLRTGKCDA